MAPSSPLVVKMVGMERRQLSWQRGLMAFLDCENDTFFKLGPTWKP
jgi:hypothetical protein